MLSVYNAPGQVSECQSFCCYGAAALFVLHCILKQYHIKTVAVISVHAAVEQAAVTSVKNQDNYCLTLCRSHGSFSLLNKHQKYTGSPKTVINNLKRH